MSIVIADDDKGPLWQIDEVYGRKEELDTLNKMSDEKASRCVLIQGTAGTGKTTLLRSIKWEEKNWVFVEGKFEKDLCTEPYSALIRVLDRLVEIWLENNKAAPVCQMSNFRQLLEDDIDLLKGIVPGMFRIVGKVAHEIKYTKMSSLRNLTQSYENHHVTEEKVGAESVAIANAFLRLFTFLSSSRPIVLLLDDIHCADSASMEIVELISHNNLSNPIEHSGCTLLALSYNGDLIGKNKFASATVESIKAFENGVHSIELEDLDVDSLNKLVASVVGSNTEITLPLSKVIHKKTAGNPFAVSQFLRYARIKEFFTFSPMTFSWQWGDVEKLDEYAAVSDNVAEILATSMEKLAIPSRIVLKVSSCLGKVIPIDVLIEYFSSKYQEGDDGHLSCPEVQGIHEHGLDSLLAEAAKAGILVKSMTQGAYVWSNDKLQEVAYSFVPVDFRPTLHQRLGKLLWRLGLENDEEWMIFMAANQMNRYADLGQEDCALGTEVAQLNLQAAKLSLDKAALYPALELLEKAERHMGVSNRWVDNYDLTLDLMTNLAETKFRIGQAEDALSIAGLIIENAKSLNDQFRANLVRLQGCVSGRDRDYELGVEKTLEVLKLYGEKHPKKLYPGQKCVEKVKLKKLLPGGELEGLLELPDMVDETALSVQSLLINHLAVYAGMSQKYRLLAWFASVRSLKHACKLGLSPITNQSVLNIAIQMRLEGHFQEASQYADFALKMLERFPRKPGSNHGYLRVGATSTVLGAVRSFNNCLNELVEGRGDLLKSGRTTDAVNASLAYASVYICVGLPLTPLEVDLQLYHQDAKQFGAPYTIQQVFLFFRQAILNLRQTDVKNPTLLVGEAMNQERELEKVQGNGRKMTQRDINSQRLMLSCIFDDWDTAELMLDGLEEWVDATEVFIFRLHYRRCYMGLAGFALSRVCKNSKKRKKFLGIGKKMLKFFTTDMKYGSVNAYPIVSMLEAEESPSKESYDKAIKACARLGLIHHEAYMCERAGRFFVEKGDDEWGEFYFGQAILLYGEWGAKGKAEKLTDDNSRLLSRSSLRESVNTSLQGRSRYSAKELDSLRVIDWQRFSIGSHG
ncbi:unnamed protein product [Cylindrotheca closterium]|uniref:AAA+ ATPase domain-containing protein n=1 Tax=Cylindrotheca closterium TaxID=2856 RepID=A0AAD2FN39_9STRA|nr:unnamed protein product [Cylindrotheca closterium]